MKTMNTCSKYQVFFLIIAILQLSCARAGIRNMHAFTSINFLSIDPMYSLQATVFPNEIMAIHKKVHSILSKSPVFCILSTPTFPAERVQEVGWHRTGDKHENKCHTSVLHQSYCKWRIGLHAHHSVEAKIISKKYLMNNNPLLCLRLQENLIFLSKRTYFSVWQVNG